MKKAILLLFCITMVVGLASAASAMPILTGTSSDGLTWSADVGTRSAQVVFSSDGLLTATLCNLSTDNKIQPNEVLVGMLFTVTGGTLSDPNVTATPSTIRNNDGTLFMGKSGTEGGVAKANVYFGNDLNGEYGWLTGLTINGVSGFYGISSSAYDPLGFGRIDQNNYYDPPSPDGAEFGLVGPGGTDINTAIAQYVKNCVTITWEYSGAPVITRVDFLYGTSFTGTVPEPSTMLLLGAGLIGLAAFGRKRLLTK